MPWSALGGRARGERGGGAGRVPGRHRPGDDQGAASRAAAPAPARVWFCPRRPRGVTDLPQPSPEPEQRRPGAPGPCRHSCPQASDKLGGGAPSQNRGAGPRPFLRPQLVSTRLPTWAHSPARVQGGLSGADPWAAATTTGSRVTRPGHAPPRGEETSLLSGTTSPVSVSTLQ